MHAKLVVPTLLLCFGWPVVANSRSTPQRLWTLPAGATFEGLSERPDNRLAIYWSRNPSLPGYQYVRFSTLNGSGKLLQGGEVPGHHFAGSGIAREDWNVLGQHAFLPQCDASTTNFLRLKNGDTYRVLRILPRFDEWTLQDLRFSLDGECLYVLGVSKLWIIGVQSGRLLRVVKPRWGARWSDENAALSPDCHNIVGMRGKMTLFSTRNGRLLRRFGIKVETLTGSCGSLEARIFFSQNGQFVIASLQDETWVYPAHGGALHWYGSTTMPYYICETARGHFFLDTPSINEYGAVSTVLRRWRDGKVGWHLKLNFNYSDLWLGPHLVFSRDGRWIYFARDKSVWRVATPIFPRSRAS